MNRTCRITLHPGLESFRQTAFVEPHGVAEEAHQPLAVEALADLRQRSACDKGKRSVQPLRTSGVARLSESRRPATGEREGRTRGVASGRARPRESPRTGACKTLKPPSPPAGPAGQAQPAGPSPAKSLVHVRVELLLAASRERRGGGRRVRLQVHGGLHRSHGLQPGDRELEIM